MVAAEEEAAVGTPVRFATSRLYDNGHVTNDFVYEFVYRPRPVRLLNESKVCSGLLRPAVQDGKVEFQFYGINMPSTGDHARCWAGQLFISELQLGRLSFVEYIVPSEFMPHPQRQWWWHVWQPDLEDPTKRGPCVEVCMHINTRDGIAFELFGGKDEAARDHVYRVLHQYCDEEDVHWRPIPEPSNGSQTQKVHRTRAIPEEICQERLMGMPMKELQGKDALSRSLQEIRHAEDRVLGCLEDIEDSKFAGEAKELMLKLGELHEPLIALTSKMRMRIKPEWKQCLTSAQEVLLDKLIGKPGTGSMSQALEIVNQLSNLGVPPPSNLGEAKKLKN
mmetsp:Transcript_11490/g.20323  ORF Transcript_11490/g.20323 Transcript_11490/m.20323 type:complete len:335 (+) Transcript_11490:46-1050(+)